MKVVANALLFTLADVKQFSLMAFALGDVTNDPAEDASVSGADLTDGQFHWEDGAVAPLGDDFPADSDDPGSTALKISLHIAVMVRSKWLGHEDIDVLANDLFDGITEHLLGRAIERFDRTLIVDNHDSFDGGVEDGV